MVAARQQGVVMSFSTASNTTRFFSVVGPAYVAESHAEQLGHLAARNEFAAVQTGIAGLWLSFFAAIGISLVNTNQAAKALQVAATAMQ
jgi:hypothetical protein